MSQEIAARKRIIRKEIYKLCRCFRNIESYLTLLSVCRDKEAQGCPGKMLSVPGSHLMLYPLLLTASPCRAQLSIICLQAPKGEKGISFQTKLVYKELSETEQHPSMTNSLAISLFCVFPRIRTIEMCGFPFTVWTRE